MTNHTHTEQSHVYQQTFAPGAHSRYVMPLSLGKKEEEERFIIHNCENYHQHLSKS